LDENVWACVGLDTPAYVESTVSVCKQLKFKSAGDTSTHDQKCLEQEYKISELSKGKDTNEKRHRYPSIHEKTGKITHETSIQKTIATLYSFRCNNKTRESRLQTQPQKLLLTRDTKQNMAITPQIFLRC
jgi:hypothetical protein